jgi:hypothetical protein
MMVPFYFALYLAIFGVAVGYVWRWAREVRRPRRNYDAPYFKGEGEPQPGQWSPDRAWHRGDVKIYPSIKAYREEREGVA